MWFLIHLYSESKSHAGILHMASPRRMGLGSQQNNWPLTTDKKAGTEMPTLFLDDLLVIAEGFFRIGSKPP